MKVYSVWCDLLKFDIVDIIFFVLDEWFGVDVKVDIFVNNVGIEVVKCFEDI